MLVETVLGKLEDFQIEGRVLDYVLLTREELQKSHQKLLTEGGGEVAVSLSPGEHLFGGAVLYRDEKRMIAVDLAREDVLEIRPEGSFMFGRVAYNIGNMHHPAYLKEGCILCPYDPVIERLIKSMDVEYERSVKKMDGVRANFTVAGHSHGAAHSHPPDHGGEGGHG